MTKKQIVFYCVFHPTVMIYKIAKKFRETGYETILFTICDEDRFDHIFYKQAFNKIICSNFQFSKQNFKNPLYLLKRTPDFLKFLFSMKFIKPPIIIGICPNNWQLKLAYKYFFRKYPFIYFPYDILSHFFKSSEEALKVGVPNFEITAEKYLFENTDGIMHKGAPNELKHLEGRLHKKINFQKNQISFFPYYSEEFATPLNKNKLSKKDGEIHLVNIGFLPDKPEFTKKLLNVLDKLLKQKIHIHTYAIVPHISKKEENKYVQKLYHSVYKNKYFHLHKPLGPKELIPEISKYDFGFLPVVERTENNMEPYFVMANRISSFFEAGLPFIYDDEALFINKLMKSYDLDISYNEKNCNNLNKKLQKLNYKKLEKNVKKAINDFDIDKHFPRLEKFVKKAIDCKK